MEKKLGNKQLLKQIEQLTDKYDNSVQLNEAYSNRIKSLEKIVATLTAEKVQLSAQVDGGIEVKTRLNNRIMRLEDELMSSHREISKQRNELQAIILNQSEQIETAEKQRDIYHKAWKASSVKTYMACGLTAFISLYLVAQSLWQMYSGS